MSEKSWFQGKIIGRLTILDKEKLGWNVKCQCGNKQYYSTSALANFKAKGSRFECSKCRYQRRFPCLQDKVFGRLTVLRQGSNHGPKRSWVCKCECGIEKEFRTSSLTRKDKPSRSCGCLARKLHSKWVNTTQYPPAHKLRAKDTDYRHSMLYAVRNSMVSSCYNPKDINYVNHGAKGQTVCELWRNGAKDFVDWALSNGYSEGNALCIKPEETIYCPENCYIDTKKNVIKRNNSIFVTCDGKTQSLSDWAFELGCSLTCLSNRLKKYKDLPANKILDLSFRRPSIRAYKGDEYENEIVDMYQKGHSYKEICDELGCSSSTILRFLKKHSINIRSAACRSADKIKDKLKYIHRLKRDGYTFKKIGEMLDLDPGNIGYHYRNWIEKATGTKPVASSS